MSTTVSPYLDNFAKEFQAKLAELRPAAEEYGVLSAAWDAFSSAGNGTATQTPRTVAKRLTSRPAARQAAKRAGNRRGRPAGSGKRSAEVIAWLGKHPDSTIADVAKGIGMDNANYLYRVIPPLVEAGKLTQDCHGFSVAA